LTRRGQRGQAIVIIALMLTVLIGMVALAIDGSRAYALRRDLQAAVDASALAAGDKLQQTGSFVTAEQAATNLFGSNMRLYSAPGCSAYGTPGASPWTVTCTYSDGTVLTDVARSSGPQGSRFTMTATRNLQLQFSRVLASGVPPTLGATANGDVNNQRFTPAVGALNQSGCGGAAGSAITINAAGTLGVTGDMVSNGAINVTSGTVTVAGDVYARCQSPVAGASNTCYPSGAGTPCTYPDVAGSTRSGFRMPDPAYAAPAVTGGSQGVGGSNVVILPGVYASLPILNANHCWFLSGGVYEFLAGTLNLTDLVSNELKPPDEPDATNNMVRAATQFWTTPSFNCSGSFQLQKQTGPRDVPFGNWGFEITAVRTDSYNGATYTRESARSMCRQINLNNHFDDVLLSVSNVPGATSYNIYASPPPGACSGPFGFASNLPVVGAVTNVKATGARSAMSRCFSARRSTHRSLRTPPPRRGR
jgi:Flp pilus assembly protein TadG